MDCRKARELVGRESDLSCGSPQTNIWRLQLYFRRIASSSLLALSYPPLPPSENNPNTIIMAFFGLGRLVYVLCLMVNAIAVLSEDRFLARSTRPSITRPANTTQTNAH